MSTTNKTYMVNLDRILADLDEVNAFTTSFHGRTEGITRRSFTEEDSKARAWLVAKLHDLGLDVVVDGIGNVRASTNGKGKKVVVGSHLDTIPNGGRYDGILGIVSGLEALRVIRERNLEVTSPIELVAFTDEEERFMSFLGSYAYTGDLQEDMIGRLYDSDGKSLKDCMRQCGFDPKNAISSSKAQMEDVKAFVELHVEQGPLLDMSAVNLGVVDQVKGNYRYGIRITGKADHAGFPMEGRSDAFLALLGLLNRVHALTRAYEGKGLLFTIGDVKILPGLENVVPEFAYCSIDFRVGNAQILDKLDQNLKSFIVDMTRQGQFTVETDIILRLPPVPMNEEVCLAIESSADEVDISHMRISSGAGHDAQVLAKKVPTAMIFVPSKDGRSHRPDEYSAPEDICNGAEVLLRTILTLAR